jgi:hypothetical protein
VSHILAPRLEADNLSFHMGAIPLFVGAAEKSGHFCASSGEGAVARQFTGVCRGVDPVFAAPALTETRSEGP